ncbi:hypothetical protein LSM04_006572 [Trypanosoma melophagium]|uniref:uncharacterized protein n=1 Tax=Trypanosoma melophagium TaxID=715481 RepID=UPI00351A0418|nr:hypothetical protein LSM04_006572 [Trypanosoma melophagium]
MSKIEESRFNLVNKKMNLLKKIRQVNDAELRVTNNLRQLNQKEAQLKSLAESKLKQMKNELHERESLVNQ